MWNTLKMKICNITLANNINITNKTKMMVLFIILALLNTLILAPGTMTSDSIAMYSEAIMNSYSDHHPPLTSYLWHYLNLIYPGPLLMFVINMAMLWGSIYVLIFKIFSSTRLRLLSLAIPFSPWVMVYSGFIWKDLIFTFGYGLLAMIIAQKNVSREKFSIVGIILFLAAIIYFTAAKFQAAFILPIMLFWLIQTQTNDKKIKTLILTMVAFYILHATIININNSLVTNRGNGSSNSWQYVKIYDLAAMSVYTKQMLVPKSLLKHEDITTTDIAEKLDLLWEPLIVYPDSPLRKTRSASERQLLLKTWRQQVLQHPFAYLKHRGYIWGRGLILAAPMKSWVLEHFNDNNFFKKYLFHLASFSAFIFLLPWHLFFFFLGFKALRVQAVHARILLYLETMGLTLLIVLFIFSLASVPRYIYFTVYHFMLSLPFALKCVDALLKERGFDNFKFFVQTILSRRRIAYNQ